MKRKTWIVSALMYTLVFLVCFGVLHFFKKITTAIDSTEYTTETGADTDIVIDGTDTMQILTKIIKMEKTTEMVKQDRQEIQKKHRMRLMEKEPISAGRPAIKAGTRL